MKKTLLLCFIHGFKVRHSFCPSNDAVFPLTKTQGDDDTFGKDYGFAQHLGQLVGKQHPKINVNVIVYPRYETRGDLGNCVGRFRDW